MEGQVITLCRYSVKFLIHFTFPTLFKRIYIYETPLLSQLCGSGFDIHRQLVWSICVHMLAMGRRQMCPNISMLLIFANAVYKHGYFSLPNCVWSGGSSLQYHTWDVSCRLKSEPPFSGQPWPGPTEALEIHTALPREDHLVTLGAALMCSKWRCIQTYESHGQPSQNSTLRSKAGDRG